MAISSRFADRFDTNYIPSNEELEEIKTIIRGPEEEIARLSQEVLELQTRLYELQRFVDGHRHLISTVRRIPEEVLEEIFVRCLPEDTLPGRTVKDAPLLLTTICRSWRRIVLNTPRLWSAIHIFIPSPSGELAEAAQVRLGNLMKARQEGVRLWLERSGSLPLSLSLSMLHGPSRYHADPHSNPRTIAQHTRFLKFISQYSPRWKSLSLYHISKHAMPPLDALTREDLPLLENFREVGVLASYYPGTSPLVKALEDVHSLRSLSIGVHSETTLSLPVKWGLTVLRLSITIPPRDNVYIIRTLSSLCPQIVECTLKFMAGDVIRDDTTSFYNGYQHPIEWSYLQEFDLTLTGRCDSAFEEIVFRIFQSLTTPSLTHLSLCLTSYGVMGDKDIQSFYLSGRNLPFHNLIVRSHCDITNLTLKMPFPDFLGDTLDLMTSLTSLRISPIDIIRANSQLDLIIQALGEVDRSHLRCPNIQNLVIGSCHPRDALSLVDLVETRRRFGSALKTFRAHFGVIGSTVLGDMAMLEAALESARLRGIGVGVDVRWVFVRRDPPGNISDTPYPRTEVHLDQDSALIL